MRTRGCRRLPLLGRRAELASSVAVVDSVAAATGQVLFIEGEAGIGKTRLLEEVLGSAAERGFTVLRGAGRQLETDLPFAPLVTALELGPGAEAGRRAAVGRLLVEEPTHHAASLGPGADGAQRRTQILQSMVDLIEDICAGPLVLALDDAHWIDGPSLAVVDRLVGRLAHLPLLLVLTARPYPRSQALHGVVDRLLRAGAAHVQLAGLDSAALAALAREALCFPPGPGVIAALATVAGNPLFATELLVAFQQDGAIEVRDGIADLRTPQVPPSLRRMILRRLRVLPEEAVELLRVAAVLGSEFDPGALAAVVGRSTLEVLRELDPAVQGRIVTGVDGGLAFHHDLVRDAIYEDLPEAVRAGLHAAAARALADAGHPPEATAQHLLRGTLQGDPAPLEQLRSVASRLGPRAPDLAAELLRRALDLAPADAPQRDDLRVELARSLGWAHQPEAAAELADQLLRDLAPGGLRRAALTVRVMQAEFLGGFERFGGQLEAAAAEPDADPRERARLLALATVAWVYGDDPARAMAVGAQALEIAEWAGDDVAVCVTLMSQAVTARGEGDDAEAILLARRAVEVAHRSSDPELHRLVPPELTLADILGEHPDHRAEAIDLVRTGLATAEERGLPGLAARFHLGLGVMLHRAGRWDDAVVELEAALERALELGHDAASFPDVFGRVVRIHVHRDDLAAAASWLARALEGIDGEELPIGYAVHVALARAAVLDAMGDREAARDVLVDVYARTPPAVRQDVAEVVGNALVRLVAATDHGRDVAEQVVADLVDDPTDLIVPWLRGAFDGDVGELREALARARAHGTRLHEELPLLLEDVADVLVRTGERRDEAAGLLIEALEVWEEMGAARETARLAARLRDLGVRRGVRGRRNRPSTGWAALTATEQRVVDLVAEGLLYREVGERMFISRRTVETHVRHVFTKLDVSSRKELEDAHAEREATLPSTE